MPKFNTNIRIGSTRARVNRSPAENGYARDIAGQMRNVESNLKKLIDKMEDATPEAMIEALQPTFDKSQEYVPVDSAELKNSGFLEIREFRGNPRVELGYAKGGQPNYAAIVHERTDMYHKAPTRAKWLQVALEETMDGILERFAKAFSGRL